MTLKVYKIYCDNSNICYIGSTTRDCETRLNEHKNKYKQYQKDKLKFLSVFKLFDAHGIENCKVMELEKLDDSQTIQDLKKREGYYIKTIEGTVNKFIAGRDWCEYQRDNKEKINEKRFKPKFCECCNCSVAITNWSHHVKTKKHKNNLI